MHFNKVILFQIKNFRPGSANPGQPAAQSPQLNVTCSPFESTFVEHHGSVCPSKVHASCVIPLYLKGKTQRVPPWVLHGIPKIH